VFTWFCLYSELNEKALATCFGYQKSIHDEQRAFMGLLENLSFIFGHEFHMYRFFDFLFCLECDTLAGFCFEFDGHFLGNFAPSVKFDFVFFNHVHSPSGFMLSSKMPLPPRRRPSL